MSDTQPTEETPQRPSTEEEYARKESELEAAREEHRRRVGGTNPERISSAEETDRQMQESVSDYNKQVHEQQGQ